MKNTIVSMLYAILAAVLYAINVPLSKLLIGRIQPVMMASFLYLGAGVGMFLYGTLEKLSGKKTNREPLTKKELPYTVAMVVLDIAAPIFLMLGISRTTSATVSLLNNFEIVATSVIALVIFGEMISKKLWLAIALVTVSSAILTFEGGSLVFGSGALFVLLACVLWGLENNCTKKISNKSSVEIVVIKGTFSGLGSLVVALTVGERFPSVGIMLCAMLLGFVAYGLSIHFYIMAQNRLGAAKTSAFYSIAPFLGVLFSLIMLREVPGLRFYIALVIMIAATYIMAKDTVSQD